MAGFASLGVFNNNDNNNKTTFLHKLPLKD